ncbi:hypothetical protein [Catellatospora methionotrophica]|uniref:hypothetical protein n=1 Tax=Catellatospora methionotrophica TaxID=121620 RepID=UPI0033FE18F5
MPLQQPHPDSAVLDRLTAYLNTSTHASASDVVDLLTSLITDTGRPLLRHTFDIETEVVEDRHGIAAALIHIGSYTIRVAQPTDDHADIVVAITCEDRDDYGLAITVDGRPVLDAMPMTWTSSVPADLQLAPPAERRRTFSTPPR